MISICLKQFWVTGWRQMPPTKKIDGGAGGVGSGIKYGGLREDPECQKKTDWRSGKNTKEVITEEHFQKEEVVITFYKNVTLRGLMIYKVKLTYREMILHHN